MELDRHRWVQSKEEGGGEKSEISTTRMGREARVTGAEQGRELEASEVMRVREDLFVWELCKTLAS